MNPLWPHQQTLLTDIRTTLALPEHSAIAVMPTGAGKSRVMCEMIHGAYRKGNPALLTVPNPEILGQFVADLEAGGIKPTVLRAGKRPDLSQALAVVAMSQTLNVRDVTWPVRLILDDEIHRLTDQRIAAAQRFPGAYRVGFTATPARLNSTPLSDYSPHLVLGPSVADLQRLGILVPCTTFQGPSPDLQGIGIVAGDYEKKGLEKAHRRVSLIGEVPRQLLRLAGGRRGLGFTTGRAHSADLVAACQAAGLRSECIDGTATPAEREAALNRLRRGELDWLWNCQLWVEGLNQVEIDAIALCLSTLSVAKYMQIPGRGLRQSPHTGKVNCLILDFGGNSFQEVHGLVDQERDWENGGKVRAKPDGIMLRTCKECIAVWAGSGPCPRCGAVGVPGDRAPARTVTADLKPVTAAELGRIAAAVSKGVPPRPAPPWATNVGLWTTLERKRQREGYDLGDGSRAHPGYTVAMYRRLARG